MGWKVYGMGRSFEGEDMDRELEKAYKEGYRDAMEEMEDRYGERGGRGGRGRALPSAVHPRGGWRGNPAAGDF